MEELLIYKEKELKNLTFIKVLLMIIIIFYHSILAWGDNFEFLNVTSSSKILYYIQQFTTTFHTRCFTIISGYLFFYLKHEAGKYDKFGPFVYNKFKRLMIPYLFVGLFFMIPFAAYVKDESLKDIFEAFILGKTSDQLWFLLMLFAEFIIFYAFDRFVKRFNLLPFVIALIFLAVGYLLRSNDISYFGIDGVLMYFLFFLIGYKFRQKGSNKLYKVKSYFYLIYLALMFALFVVSKELKYQLASDIVSAIMFITNGPIMYILFQKLANKIKYENKVFDFIKGKSFTMYLFHQQFIYLFILLTIGMKSAELNALLVFALSFIASLIVSIIMQSNKITRFLIGEK